MKQDERRCLEDLVAGRDAWGTFWQLFGYVIVSEVAKFHYSDPSLVDDIYQDLCLKLMRNDHRVIRRYLANPFRSSFGAFARKITKHMLIDYYRQHNKRKFTDVELSEISTVHAPASEWSVGPERQLSPGNGVADILLDVAGGDKNADSYQMLFLRFVEGERVSVIAERFGMKQNTVTKRIEYYVDKVRREHMYDLMELIDE